jgi:aminoglycoside 3-N-acetyltransferase
VDRQERILTEQLLELGVQRGGVLVVHTSFSQVGPFLRGPMTLIAALRDALGPDGTLVMPSMSDDDERPFDVGQTPCRSMGVVAETFWRLPDVLRSDNPHAFAASGAYAKRITASHPLDVPHGLDSPIGRVWELDGQVLLLGVGHDANTTIHLAENIAGVRYQIAKHLAVWRGDAIEQLHYHEVDHCCAGFAQMDDWLESGGRQRRGHIGRGPARLARSRDIVEVALRELRRDETVFLHSAGVCEECDLARASIGYSSH